MIKDADTGLAEAFKQGAEGIEQEWFESLVVSDLEAETPVDGSVFSPSPLSLCPTPPSRVPSDLLLVAHTLLVAWSSKSPTGQFHLILTLRLPPSSRAAETQPWIELACNVADVINGKTRLLPESSVASIVRSFSFFFLFLSSSAFPRLPLVLPSSSTLSLVTLVGCSTVLTPYSSPFLPPSQTRRRAEIFSSLAPSTTTTTTSSSSTTTPSPSEQIETGTLADKRRLEREQQEEALAGMTPVERVRMRLKQREEERKKGGRERRR